MGIAIGGTASAGMAVGVIADAMGAGLHGGPAPLDAKETASQDMDRPCEEVLPCGRRPLAKSFKVANQPLLD